MVMLLRYLFIFFRRPWRDRQGATAVTHYRFRVMPWDVDLNMHLTNTRYPALLDVSRVQWFVEIGFLPLIIKQGWRVVVASQTITFVREIKPFAMVDIESRVVYWDRKYLYSEHRFLVDGKLHCKALGRLALVKKGRVNGFSTLMRALDKYYKVPSVDYVIPEPTPEIQAKIDLLSLKRQTELDRERDQETAGL